MIERRSYTTTQQPATHARLTVTIPFNSPSVDLGGFTEQIAPKAFERTLRDASIDVLALWSHDPSKPLARRSNGTLELSADAAGLTARINADTTSWSEDARRSVADGTVTGASFAFAIREDRWRRTDDGRWERTLLDVDLIEVSPTAAAAYPGATAAAG